MVQWWAWAVGLGWLLDVVMVEAFSNVSDSTVLPEFRLTGLEVAGDWVPMLQLNPSCTGEAARLPTPERVLRSQSQGSAAGTKPQAISKSQSCTEFPGCGQANSLNKVPASEWLWEALGGWSTSFLLRERGFLQGNPKSVFYLSTQPMCFFSCTGVQGCLVWGAKVDVGVPGSPAWITCPTYLPKNLHHWALRRFAALGTGPGDPGFCGTLLFSSSISDGENALKLLDHFWYSEPE